MSVKSLSSKNSISKSQSNPSLSSANTLKPKAASGLSVIKNAENKAVPTSAGGRQGSVASKKDEPKEDLSYLNLVSEIIRIDSCSRRIQIEQYIILLQDTSTTIGDRIVKAEILSKVTAALGVCSSEGDIVLQSITTPNLESPQQSVREGSVLLIKALLKALGRMFVNFEDLYCSYLLNFSYAYL